MNIKKILIILICLFVFTGCKVENISNDDIMKNVELILNKNIKYSNQDAIGYQYYLPNYMSVSNVDDFNQEIRYESETFYMYVDVVSYYYKISDEYEVDEDAYISEKLTYDDKQGYLQINIVDGKYYIEMMYNYAKIEAYVSEYDLVDSVSSISYILSSIKYNDNVIETLLGSSKYDLGDNETYNLFDNKETTTDNFLDYINEYDNYDASSEAESLIEKDEIDLAEEEE